MNGLVHHHRQEAVLERVAAEDVGEGQTDHGLEAEALERPHRVLPRGAAPEVASGHQHARALRLGFVERELGTGPALGVVAAIGE